MILMDKVFNSRTVRRILTRATAGTVTEYAIIISIVSIAGVILLAAIGKQTNNLLDTMNANFPK